VVNLFFFLFLPQIWQTFFQSYLMEAHRRRGAFG